MAVNSEVNAPRQRQTVKTTGLSSMRGWKRMRRKIPATTMVLEWSRADTGVGPSMADGSHGCRPNWADFPVAAKTSPDSGIVMSKLFDKVKIC